MDTKNITNSGKDPEADELDVIKVKRKNANKRVRCRRCSKSMRSDVLKRHLNTHTDILSLPDEKLLEEVKARDRDEKELESKRQKIEKSRWKMDAVFLMKLS